jgi:hypothetical protein
VRADPALYETFIREQFEAQLEDGDSRLAQQAGAMFQANYAQEPAQGAAQAAQAARAGMVVGSSTRGEGSGPPPPVAAAPGLLERLKKAKPWQRGRIGMVRAAAGHPATAATFATDAHPPTRALVQVQVEDGAKPLLAADEGDDKI